MASSFLQKKAQTRAEVIDEKYGAGSYGGTGYSSPSSTSMAQSSGANSSPAAASGSSFLQRKIQEREQQKGAADPAVSASSAAVQPVTQTYATPTKRLKEDDMTSAEYAELISHLENQLGALKRTNDPVANVPGYTSPKEGIPGKYDKRIQQLEARLAEVKDKKYWRDNADKYAELGSQPDFADNSKAGDRGKGKDARWAMVNQDQTEWNSSHPLNSKDMTFWQRLEQAYDPSAYIYGQTANDPGAEYSLMTDNEKANYNYLYNTQGEKAAGEYLDYISYDLNARRANAYGNAAKELADELPVLASAVSIDQNLKSVAGLVDVAAQNIRRDHGGEWKPIDYNTSAMDYSRATTAIRGTVSNNIADATGRINIDAEQHPFWAKLLNGKSLGDVYQLGMSMADSAVVAATAGPLGSVLLGGSAGSQGVLTAIENGANDEQALAMGMLNGAFEAIFEYISLDKLVNGDTGKIVRDILVQSGVEGSEELATTIANTIADVCVMAENSDYQRSIREYMEQGMSQQEAESAAMQDIMVGMGWDFIGGALSGGIMGGGKSVISSADSAIQAPSQYAATYGSNVSELVSEALEIDPDNKLAQQIQQKLEQNKRVSDRNIMNLVQQNTEAMKTQDKATISKAAAEQLTKYGETGNVDAIAQAIAKQTAGEKLTREERQTIEASRYAQRVINELDPENISSGEFNTAWAESLNTDQINPESYGRLVQEAQLDPTEADTVSAAQNAGTESVSAQVGADTAARANTAQTAPAQSQSTVQRTAPKTLEEGAKSFGTQAKAYISTFLAGQNIGKYDAAYRQAHEYGMSQVPYSAIQNNASIAYLTDAQREAAYMAGRDAAAAEAKSSDASRAASPKRGSGKGGTVRADGVTLKDLQSTLNDKQKVAYKILSRIADATGINIVLYSSAADSNGRYTAAEGSFNWDDNTIYLDVNAGLSYTSDVGKMEMYTMLRTFSHEYVHFIEKFSPEMYNELREAVFEQMQQNLDARSADSETKQTVDDLISRKLEMYRAKVDPDFTYEQASREVVADSLTEVLPQAQFVEQLYAEHQSIFRQMVEKLKEFLSNIKAYFSGLAGNTKLEAAALSENINGTIKYVQSIVDAFDAAAKSAAENYQQMFNDNGDTVGMADHSGHAQMSMRTYDEGGREKLESFLQDRVDNGAITAEERTEMLEQMNFLYDICKEYAKKYTQFGEWSRAEVTTDPKTGNAVFSVVKANGEYAMNLDFSLVCKKRRTLDAVFNQMINDGIMDDFDMGAESIAKINDIIRENNFETACALCFVDSKRYRQALVADSFVTMYNPLVRSMAKDGQSIDSFNFGGDRTVTNTGDGIDTLPDSELNFDKINEVLRTAGKRTVEYKIAKNLKDHPADRKLLSRGDFMSTAGFDNLNTNNKRILGLYNAKKGAGGPKAAQSDVQYLSEILTNKKFNRAKAYSVGGVRIQSFSDYIPRLVFDYCQMIADLSAKGLPAHAYTKEALFALQFGLTGVKTNMSLVPEVIEGGIAPGLDADGNYAWRDGQSFGSTVYGGSKEFIQKCYDIIGKKYSGQDRLTAQEGFELAKAIQSAAGYGDNCGTIAVGVSHEHIAKLLADPDIRMVIPYHKSSLNHIVAVMTNIDKYTNYTGVQNTRDAKTGTKISKKDFNYNDALQRLGDAKAAADEYLEWCRKNDYIPKFDEFAGEENYYKLLEDFSCYDGSGAATMQQDVKLQLPTEGSPFGSMAEMMRMGLDEDVILQAKQDKAIPDIVRQIKNTLPRAESGQQFAVREELNEAETKAAEIFGTTENFAEAGYILPNGKMLNFANKAKPGERDYDHRAIALAYGENVDLNVNHGHVKGDYLERFVNDGSIRIEVGDPDLDIDSGIQLSATVPPTAQQEQTIREFLQWKQDRDASFEGGEDTLYRGTLPLGIDFGGDSDIAAGYSNASSSRRYIGEFSPDRVINDIRQYYRTGVAPQQSVVSQFHTQYSVRGENFREEVQKFDADAQKILKDARMRMQYAESATMTESRFNDAASELQAGKNNNGHGYFVGIDPFDFLSLTTGGTVQEFLDRNPNRLNEGVSEDWGTPNDIRQSGRMYLRVEDDGKGHWKVIGHEGRHRMAALYREGIDSVAIMVLTDPQTDMKPIDMRRVYGQFSDTYEHLHRLIPGSYEYQNVARQIFTGEQGNMQYAVRDDEYLELAKDPEHNKARLDRIVRDAAKDAGYTTQKLYHGTGAFGFTKFRKGAIYATVAQSVAAGYNRGGGLGRVRNASLKYIPNDGTAETAVKNAKSILQADLHKYTEEDKAETLKAADETIKTITSQINEIEESIDQQEFSEFWDYITEKYGDEQYLKYINAFQGLAYMLSADMSAEDLIGYYYNDFAADMRHYSERKQIVRELEAEERDKIKGTSFQKFFRYLNGYDFGDALIDLEYGILRAGDSREKLVNPSGGILFLNDIIDAVEEEKNVGIYELYGNVGNNPLVIDEGKVYWDSIPFDGKYHSTDYIVNWAKENGYTSVLFKNVLDPSAGGSANIYADEYVFFDSEQVKSADPVTYDDNGKVIPLSERFSNSDDIRYQLRDSGNISDREVLRMAAKEAEQNNRFTEPERAALFIFKARLNKLDGAEKMRQDYLKQKRELLKGRDPKNVTGDEKAELRKIQNNLDTANAQIRRFNDDLLKVESQKVLHKVLQESRTVVENDVREKGFQKLQEYKQKRNETEAVRKHRKSIAESAAKLSSWLQKNSDKEHIPEALKKPVAELLSSIDLSSKRALSGGELTQADRRFKANLAAIQKLVSGQQGVIEGSENAVDNIGAYIDLSEENREFLNAIVNTLASVNGTYTINTMTEQELEGFDKLLKNLSTAIRKANRALANARYQSIPAMAQESMRHMAEMGNADNIDTSSATRFIGWQNATPYYAMKRFGAAGTALFDGLTKGWEKLAVNAKEVIDFAEKTYTAKEIREWRGTVHDIELQDGHKLRMTEAQIMALSQLILREQAMRHISAGGIRIGSINGKQDKVNGTTHYHLTQEDINNILSLLTDRQKQVADRLRGFMAERGGQWGNEISMARFGYEFYTEGNLYFPIRTDDTGRPMADTDAQSSSMFRLLNLSASKSLNPNANNAIIVDDIFDVFGDHMADMAKLNALGLPLLDAIKWYNYTERSEGSDGTITRNGVKKSMEAAFGNAANSYFKTLIKDINGVKDSGDRGGNLASRMMSNYKVAAVAANLRVALLQPTSYVRAMFILKPKNMIGAFFSKNAYKEALKYSGTAVWKSLGYYDTDIARSLRSQIEHDETVLDTIKEKSMTLAELGDQRTWGRLWVACKMEAKSRNAELSGEELNRATADIFREVIYATQVMDSTLTRSEMMRGTTRWTKLATAFMAEPTLSANILMDSVSQLRIDTRRTNWTEAWRLNKKKVGLAFTTYVASAAAAAFVESVMDALRDDDDYETLLDKFNQAFFGEKGIFRGNLGQDLTIIGKIPVLKDVINTLKGSKSSDMSIASVEAVTNTFNIWKETIQLANGTLEKPTKTTYYGKMTEWGKIYKTLQALSQLSGLAVSNLTRDVSALWNSTVGAFDDKLKLKTYDPGVKGGIKNAYAAGALTEEEAIDRLIAAGEAKNADDAYWMLQEEGKYKALTKALTDQDGAAFKDAVDNLTEHGVSLKNIQSQAKSVIGEMYKGTGDEEASISKSKAIDMLVKYAGMEREKAEQTALNWQCFVDTGRNYDQLKDGYDLNEYGRGAAISYLEKYGGKSKEEAVKTVDRWDFIGGSEKYDSITAAAVSSYNEFCADAGISKDAYFNAWTDIHVMEGEDRDGDGKNDAYSTMDKKLAYIAALDLTPAQKTALALASGISDKNITKRAPWAKAQW